jgi:hypothetical protein
MRFQHPLGAGSSAGKKFEWMHLRKGWGRMLDLKGDFNR